MLSSTLNPLYKYTREHIYCGIKFGRYQYYFATSGHVIAFAPIVSKIFVGYYNMYLNKMKYMIFVKMSHGT